MLHEGKKKQENIWHIPLEAEVNISIMVNISKTDKQNF